ncbi:MAG: N-acetyl-gamma-glutamyl-phosphate reductase [Acidobacteriota bacterium]|nr:N-acetyl-gamma-glutamyl-phosphate reductase [Acidobacteriota bacterium]
MRFQVGVAGHSGYSGAEIIQILRHHASVEPVLLQHRETPGRNGVKQSSHIRELPLTASAVEQARLAVVLLATAPEVSIESVPWLLRAGTRVIDLSGAFRLQTAERYERWYQAPHTEPALLAEAVYGLPEFHREQVRGARLVANPGCYPTAANLALRPLVEAGLIERASGVVCDAKSGVSGAGRKASLRTSFCEVAENFSAYSVLGHRHVPEILQVSGLEERELSFTAQLIPVERGILETIYFRAAAQNLARLQCVYESRYSGEPFIRIYPPGSLPDIRGVARTNFCDIGFVADPETGRAVVVSAIDNLGKGAAGQAVQNLNLMLGLPETEGLL